MIVRLLGPTEYSSIHQKMQDFTLNRTHEDDEIWVTEHFPVYTTGLRSSSEHILKDTSIPIIQTDRGGLITYHGPGQIITYPLINLRKNKIKPTQMVTKLEKIVIKTLHQFNISASANPEARGVYVGHKKIASIGLRIRNHCSYHGMSFNISMDLLPFKNINPCGLHSQEMTQVVDLMDSWKPTVFFNAFFEELLNEFTTFSKSIKIKYSIDNQKPSHTSWPSKSPSFK